jgi:single-strand DNA-binding protein
MGAADPRSTVNTTEITVVGNVASSPSSVRTQNGRVTNFRLAATERRYDNGSQGFVNGNTFWIDVECWNELAGNVAHSISKGDPVVVVGTIYTHEWESDDGMRSKPRIKARAVAPNLAWGTADFRKVPRSPAAPRAEEETAPGDAPTEAAFPDLSGIREGQDYVRGEDALEEKDSAELLPEPALG